MHIFLPQRHRAIIHSSFIALCLCGLLFLLCGSARAQSITGSLTGLITDEKGAPLEGAVVRAVNLTTGFDYGKVTDGEGRYRIDLLLPGEYKIIAEKTGYISAAIDRFLIEVNREKLITVPPIQLVNTASATFSAAVAAAPRPEDALQANFVDGTLRGSATVDIIDALPLPGVRSFDTLALLVAGVAPAPQTFGANGPGIGSGVGSAGQFSVNGQRARSNNFTIDGSDNNDQEVGVRRQGFITPTGQAVETIFEFQISTTLSDAEAGRNAGGIINVVSRTGANRVNGEVHSFFTDSSVNARDYFDLSGGDNPKKNPFTRVQSGAIVGLPIRSDRLHLFGAFTQQIINRGQESHFAVPTENERASSFIFARGSSQLGTDLLDPSFYPLPNNAGGPFGSNTLTRVLPASGDGSLITIKLDYRLPEIFRPSVFNARYNFTDDEAQIPVVDGAINSGIIALTRTQNLALSLNTDISSGSANQLRFSYGRTALDFAEAPGSPFIFQSHARSSDRTGDGIPDGLTGPIGRALFLPFSAIGVDPYNFPQQRAGNTFQFADTYIFTRGRNTIKIGADIRRVQINSRLDRNYRAQLAFTPGYLRLATGRLTTVTGADFAALGLPSDIFQALAVTPDSTLALRFTELNLFFQDQLRVAPRVTLTIGLRYERNSVPRDATGRLERSLRLTDRDLPAFDRSSIFSESFLNALGAQRAFLGDREEIYTADNNNFAPRLGLAWDLRGDGRSALRAGYGLFYDPLLGTIASQSRNGFPNFIPINFGSAILFPQILSANPAFLRFGENLSIPLIRPGTLNTIGLSEDLFVAGIGRLFTVGGFFVGSGFGAGVTLPDKSLRSPYTHQFSLSYEQTFLNRYTATLAYVGNTGRKLIRTSAPNGGQFTAIGLVSVPASLPAVLPVLKRPNPLLGAVTLFSSSASSNYHALQATLERRIYDTIGFQLSYTYSHAIDDVSDIFDLSGSFALAQDELSRREGLRAERASASFDVRHRFTSAFYLNSPFSKNRFLRDLQLAGIVTLQSGPPFTVNTSIDANFDGNLTDRLNSIMGLQISDEGPVRIKLQNGVSPLSLIALPDTDNPNNGAIGRNTFRAAGIASVDLAITKKIVLRENTGLALRMEVFNLFNRAHFGIPVRVLETPGFGSSFNTILPARTVQFALRYYF